MKMKTVFLAACALMSVAAFAADDTAATTNAPAKVKLPRGMRRYGGVIQVPNSQKGTIVIVNAQKKLPLDKIRAGMDEFAQTQKFNVKFVDGEATTPEKASADMVKIGADVAVFIQENPESSITLLNAPEQRWTILNYSAITADARNDVFAAARIRKELTRGFLCAAGAMNSQYQGSMMAAIKEPKTSTRCLRTRRLTQSRGPSTRSRSTVSLRRRSQPTRKPARRVGLPTRRTNGSRPSGTRPVSFRQSLSRSSSTRPRVANG